MAGCWAKLGNANEHRDGQAADGVDLQVLLHLCNFPIVSLPSLPLFLSVMQFGNVLKHFEVLKAKLNVLEMDEGYEVAGLRNSDEQQRTEQYTPFFLLGKKDTIIR